MILNVTSEEKQTWRGTDFLCSVLQPKTNKEKKNMRLRRRNWRIHFAVRASVSWKCIVVFSRSCTSTEHLVGEAFRPTRSHWLLRVSLEGDYYKNQTCLIFEIIL